MKIKNIRAFLLAVFFALFAAAAGAKTIAIYHTSDVHGWYSPTLEKSGKDDPGRLVGGYAALSAQVNKEKLPAIIIDSGDWFQGTPEGNVTRGEASVELMNAVGYALSGLGNHEYDFGEDNLKGILKKARFPVLAANLFNKADGKRPEYVAPYVIMEVDGVRIGVIGVMTRETATAALPTYVNHLDFRNEADAVKEMVPELKKRGVSAILVVAHNGLCKACSSKTLEAKDVRLSKEDLALGNMAIAKKSKGDIAVIFGGHNHTALSQGYYDAKTKTLFVESGSGLKTASRVTLDFDDATGKFKGAKSELVKLWVDRTGQDEAVVKVLEPINLNVGREMDKVVGTSSFTFRRSDGKYDNPVGNMMTDVMLKKVPAQIAVQNSHGLRADLNSGDVRLRDIVAVMPFENTLVTLDMTGKQLKELMKDTLSESGSLLQIAGMQVTFTVDAKGQPASVEITVDGKPVGDSQTYSVVTNNYLASGGTGGRVFLTAKNAHDTLIPMRELLVDWVKNNSPLTEPMGGRIVLKGAR